MNHEKTIKRINANPLSGTRQYRSWSSMKERCNNPNTKCFSRYGGRGIKVCNSWNSFHNFWKDMEEGYVDTLKLDRIDNEKGYSKKNCRWVTHKENCNNKGNHRSITLGGVTKNITQWAEMLGEKPQTLIKRIKRGWSIKDALLLPNLRGQRNDCICFSIKSHNGIVLSELKLCI